MLVAAMCMSLFGSAVLAVPSKVQIHIDGDEPEGTVQVSIGDGFYETGKASGGKITIDKNSGELEGLVGKTVVVTEEGGDVFEGVLKQRGNGNDNDDENGTDNYWVTLTKQDTEEPEPEAKYVPIDVDYDCEDDEVGLYGAAIENGKKYDLDMDYHTGNGGNIPPVNNVDAIQVIMSDGVKEMYNDLKGAKWVHVDNGKSAKGYYEMGLNLWNDNSYDCTEDDITGVTMSSARVGSPKLYFSMDGDNGIFAKVEVRYGKTYNPADPAHVGKEYDTMFLYCQLVSERDDEVDPEPQEMAYTVTAHYYEVKNGVESLVAI